VSALNAAERALRAAVQPLRDPGTRKGTQAEDDHGEETNGTGNSHRPGE
jgi:hypothetical protein